MYKNILSRLFCGVYLFLIMYPVVDIKECRADEQNYGTATLKVTKLDQSIYFPQQKGKPGVPGIALNGIIYLDGIKLGYLPNDYTATFKIPAKKTTQEITIKLDSNLSPLRDANIVDTDETISSQKYISGISPNDLITFSFYTKTDNTDNSMFFPRELAVLTDFTHTHALPQEIQSTLNKAKVINVTIDTNLKSKIIKESPPYNIPQGQEKTVKDTIKIIHTVTTEDKSSESQALKLKIPFVETDIRKEVQKTISKSDAEWSEVERSVKIIGDGKPIKVVWSELYRTGTAKVEVDGKIIDIPFEYKDDFDLILETLK